MKKAICISVIIINALFIFTAILVERYIFPGIYNTVLFWGIGLYALISAVIILLNYRQLKTMMFVDVAVTVIAIAWFIIYIPNFTAAEALDIIKEDPIYASYTMIEDPVTPVEETNISIFIRGSYRFICQYNPGISVVFNPETGSYYSGFSEDASLTLPSESLTDLDTAFEEEYNLIAEDDVYKKIELVTKYKARWTDELKAIYSLLYNTVSDSNKRLLNEELKGWQDNTSDAISLVTSICAQRYAASLNIDLYELESSMYRIREKTLELQRIYEKIN